MAEFDMVVRGGTVVTASDVMLCDIGIKGGRIAALAESLTGDVVVDADGLLVMPGGVDSHCHIEQQEPDGTINEESFITGSTACFAGGTTTAICFAAQFKGHPIADTLPEYQRRARTSMMDYSFHQIITDATDEVIHQEIPALVEAGIRSLKVFLTYDPLYMDDRQYLRVLSAARRYGALVTVHCENYEAIRWRSEALLTAGMSGPKYHPWSRPKVVEREATYRAIALAELVDQPIQVFHVSCSEVAEEIRRAQARGLKVWAESCPQYFVLHAADMDRSGLDGAKFMCSPSPRDPEDHEALWAQVLRGTVDVVSSDHSGSSFGGAAGKLRAGPDANFTAIPNGVPGLAARLPIIFSEGVSKGRIDLPYFVRLTATNPARLFGLSPRKGNIAIGSDADLVVWDARRRVKITNSLMQHAIDYTPYEGFEVIGWPTITIARGRVVMRDGIVRGIPGAGQFLARAAYDLIKPRGVFANNFNASAF
jgi:dihydropyrimidinase